MHLNEEESNGGLKDIFTFIQKPNIKHMDEVAKQRYSKLLYVQRETYTYCLYFLTSGGRADANKCAFVPSSLGRSFLPAFHHLGIEGLMSPNY